MVVHKLGKHAFTHHPRLAPPEVYQRLKQHDLFVEVQRYQVVAPQLHGTRASTIPQAGSLQSLSARPQEGQYTVLETLVTGCQPEGLRWTTFEAERTATAMHPPTPLQA